MPLSPEEVQRYLSPSQFGLWQAMQQVYGGGNIGQLRSSRLPVGLPPGQPPIVVGSFPPDTRGQQGVASEMPFSLPQSWDKAIGLSERLDPQEMTKTLRHEAIHGEDTFWDRIASFIGMGSTPWSRAAAQRYGHATEPLAYAGSNTVWGVDRLPSGEMVPEAYAYVAQALQSMPTKRRSKMLGYLDPAVRARVEIMLAERER